MADKLITPPFTGWFVHLNEPRGMKGDPNSEKKYQMLVVLPENDGFWKKADALIKATAREKWNKVPPKLKTPINVGSDLGNETYSDLDGMKHANVGNTRKPGVVDKSMDPITDPDELYSGAKYRASLTAYAWDHPTGGKGVSFSLNNVMKVEDGEPLDGRTSPEDDFAEFATEDGGDDEESLLD